MPTKPAPAQALVDKYRPHRFDEVVGQVEAVAYMSSQILAGHTQSIILVGPPGTGKTTLARIYANALHCEKARPEPCGRCDACNPFFDNEPGASAFMMYEYNASLWKDHGTAKEVAQWGRSPPWGKYVTFIDEVHGLDASAADALLKVVEEPAQGAFFILATSDPDAVRPALLSRCMVLQLHKLKPAEAFTLLADICRLEGITFEPKALHMLASRGAGSARDTIKGLDQISRRGHLTPGLVAQALSMTWTSHLLGWFHALGSGDLAVQEAAIAEWQAEPQMKARCIKEALLYLHNYEIARPALSEVINPAFHQINAEQRQDLMKPFRQRAKAVGMSLDRYWLGLMAFWNGPPGFLDAVSFDIHRRRFHALVNPEDTPLPVAQPEPDTKSALTRPYRARSRRETYVGRGKTAAKRTAGPPDAYLSPADAEAVYEPASFLIQKYGLLYNAHLTLDHGKLGMGDEAGAGKLVSRLTHELGQRLGQWEPGSVFHWQYVNSKLNGAVQTDVTLFLPVHCGLRAEAWMKGRLETLRPDQEAAAWRLRLDEAQYAHAPNSPASRLKMHWRVVRHLWAGVDPVITLLDGDGLRKPLVELLEVPSSMRRPAGTLDMLRRTTTSGSLGPVSRKKAGDNRMEFLSAFRDGAWDRMFKGWELDEARDRAAEGERRKDDRDLILAEFSGDDELMVRRREQALHHLAESYPVAPHDRHRSWVGWWSEI